jgi:hypothetical protein
MAYRCFYREGLLQDLSLLSTANTSKIASRKKIIIDEHSGRILVDSVLADEEKKWKSYFLNLIIFKSR